MIIQQAYESARDAIIQHFTRQVAEPADPQLYGQFMLASANLTNFLPGIDASAHAHIFSNVLMHRKLSVLDQHHPQSLRYLRTKGITDVLLEQLRQQPALICTFHTGSYRLLNLFLVYHSIPFTLVASAEVIRQEGAMLQQLYHSHTGKQDFRIIDASASHALLRMIREVKAGRSLVVYPDGNEGAGTSTRQNGNSRIISFLTQQIRARKGMTEFARATGTPILPVLCHRENDQDITLSFHDLIHQPTNISGEESTHDILQHLYRLLGSYVQQHPGQWEGWLYLHRCACPAVTGPITLQQSLSGTFCFNRNAFGLMAMGKKHFLLRKNTYTFFLIDQYLHNLLNRSEYDPLVISTGNRNLIHLLLQDKILIKLQ